MMVFAKVMGSVSSSGALLRIKGGIRLNLSRGVGVGRRWKADAVSKQVLDVYNLRLDDFGKRFDDFGKRVDDFATRMVATDRFILTLFGVSIGGLYYTGNKIDKQSEQLNAKIDKQSEQLNAKIDKQSEQLNAKSEQLNAKIDKQTEQLNAKIDTQSEQLNAKIEDIQSDIAEIKAVLMTTSKPQGK